MNNDVDILTYKTTWTQITEKLATHDISLKSSLQSNFQNGKNQNMSTSTNQISLEIFPKKRKISKTHETFRGVHAKRTEFVFPEGFFEDDGKLLSHFDLRIT